MKAFIVVVVLLMGFMWYATQVNLNGAPPKANLGYNGKVLTNSPKAVARPSDTDICITAHVFIKRQLKSPSSAVFPPCSKPATAISGAGRSWTVRSYVDAQNSYGTALRADYTVAMHYQADTDEWTMASFTLDNR